MQHYILMADIIESSSLDPKSTMQQFQSLVRKINKSFANQLLSPLTITLGDEFQGVAKDLISSVNIIIALEEKIINQRIPFKLRYALRYDQIGTPINKTIAHGMLGAGLTNTRQELSKMKKDQNRFSIFCKTRVASEILNESFIVYQEIIDRWDLEKDFELVDSFLKHKDYKIVANELGRDRSLIWRRKKTLDIVSYFAIRNVITNASLL